MTSVVIAAHNEASVIGRCLSTLLADARPGEFDVTVVANGCSDSTADVARGHPDVRVVEIDVASKPAALNAGDEVAVGFPRIYLDADINVSASVARAVRDAIGTDRAVMKSPSERTSSETSSAAQLSVGDIPMAAVPRRELDVRGRPILVRGYYSINNRLPVFTSGLFGRGMIGLSAEARARFERFPDMVADDLYLDSLFTPAEKCQVDSVSTLVAAPRTTRDLLRRLVRVRRGNTAMRAAGAAGEVAAQVRPADRSAWLREVVLPRPWLAPAGIVYVGITALAALEARRHESGAPAWGRDESTRNGPVESL